MKSKLEEIVDDVGTYYAEKLASFGATPPGVDWNGIESQTLRFEQLSKIFLKPTDFSINDLGCGYGALLDFLSSRYDKFNYEGIDVSSEMIGVAKARFANDLNTSFLVSSAPCRVADYSIASGIFNVRLNFNEKIWQDYIEATLETLDRASRIAFSFNCLTSYSDPEKMREYLYYASPTKLFDFCKKRFSKNIALLHDYGLYEFTILVRKATC